MIALIYAISKNNVIGLNNTLPWHFKEDLQYFKKTTINHPILMGHNTYKGLNKKLPHRQNIILTKNENLKIDDCLVINNIDDIIANYYLNDSNLIFIIGGKQIYELFSKYAECLYISKIDYDFEGDTFLNINTDDYSTIFEEKSLKEPITYFILKRSTK